LYLLNSAMRPHRNGRNPGRSNSAPSPTYYDNRGLSVSIAGRDILTTTHVHNSSAPYSVYSGTVNQFPAPPHFPPTYPAAPSDYSTSSTPPGYQHPAPPQAYSPWTPPTSPTSPSNYSPNSIPPGYQYSRPHYAPWSPPTSTTPSNYSTSSMAQEFGSSSSGGDVFVCRMTIQRKPNPPNSHCAPRHDPPR
jgi:hypothetical protein